MAWTAANMEQCGVSGPEAPRLLASIEAALSAETPLLRWAALVRNTLDPDLPFELHRRLYAEVYRDRDPGRGPGPAWVPDPEDAAESNVGRLIGKRSLGSYAGLFAWASRDREGFWRTMLDRLGIVFRTPCDRVLDDSGGPEHPRWLPGARLNITESCFLADADAPAIVRRREDGPLETVSFGELDRLSNRVANGLVATGYAPGDRIAVDLPMTAESVAIYLGIVKAGMAVVSIADSYAPDEIASRLRIGEAKGIFTGDVVLRGGRSLSLYGKVVAAEAPRAVVLPAAGRLAVDLRDGDLIWDEFLPGSDEFRPVDRDPDDVVNVLFSSGTTGDPKAIPWTMATPIKCAADGHLHQDVRPGRVVAWPTNLGWMMGPWLLFATLVNRGTIALYEGAPGTRGFCEFVRDAGVHVLGLVPSLVRAWRAGNLTEGLDWSAIAVFSSTGECSNAEDMLWLMSRAGYRPVIEYCGGTEIGGGYLTGTVVQPCVPAAFTTPALGLDLVVLDEAGAKADEGEVFLVPPSVGLSTRLLNRDHHEVYHEGTPAGPDGETLRRHGDRIERIPGGYFRAHGRADDTMNLSGIKVSSAELERVVNRLPEIDESAAVAVPPAGGGPDRLFLFVVPPEGRRDDPESLREACQREIRDHLNPLFRVHEVRVVESLPRTASAKVMRRVLRDEVT